jgi:hypothetical protein
VLVVEKAAQQRRTPKRVREFHADNTLLLWSAVVLGRFSIRATQSYDSHDPPPAFAARLSR